MMVVLSTVLIGVMYSFNEYSERRLYQVVTGETRDLIRSIQFAVEEMTKKENDGLTLGRFLEEIGSESIREVSIIDGSLRISESTDPDKIGDALPMETTQLLFDSEGGRLIAEKGQIINIMIPVVARGEHQGYIHIVIDAQDIRTIISENVRKRIVAAAVVLVLGILSAIALSRRYTKPIKEVVNAARAVSAGDLDITLPAGGRDEIGDLKESFNTMLVRLNEFRRLEGRLRETEHLSTIGDLSRSVAHEIRNPLNFISLSVDHLMDKAEEGPSRDLLQRIKQEIKRLDGLVANFLACGRPLKIAPRGVNIIEVMEETLSLIHARAEKAGVRIDKGYALEESVILTVDPELIKTCLFNVFRNSFQAMPDGGTLSLSIRRDDRTVTVSIGDTGIGFRKEQAEKVFEPFFTTKEGGLGLGLAMTKRVMEEHGGTIAFTSEAGKGTQVDLVFPDRT